MDYSSKNRIQTHKVLFTPLLRTFYGIDSDAVAFHGLKDPWVLDNDAMSRLCEEKRIPLFEYPETNHSLESGNVEKDLATLNDVILKVQNYISDICDGQVENE